MLTPFKALMIQHAMDFQQYIQKSINDDNSYLKGWSITRDKNLSLAQREYAKSFRGYIQGLDTNMSDEAYLQALHSELRVLVPRLKRDVAAAKGEGAATHGTCEFDLFNFRMREAYKQFEKYGLIDVKYENNAFVTLQSTLVNYLIAKETHIHALEIRYYDFWQFKDYTNNPALTAEKEKLVLKELGNMTPQDNMNTLIRRASHVIAEDLALLEQYNYKSAVPSTTTSIVGIEISLTWGYSPKLLNEMLTRTKGKLQRLQEERKDMTDETLGAGNSKPAKLVRRNSFRL